MVHDYEKADYLYGKSAFFLMNMLKTSQLKYLFLIGESTVIN